MGGFFAKGVEGHVQNGVPWPMQNGMFCATFYHFFCHDQEGPIGTYLRAMFPEAVRFGLDEQTFAAVFVSIFMQIVGILQMPAFMGPKFSPFGVSILSPWKDSSTWGLAKEESEYSKQQRKNEYNGYSRKKAIAIAKKRKSKKQ